jgi:formylglycine-generating enzyme required for sulfatase activity
MASERATIVDTSDHPVDSVSWCDAVALYERLSTLSEERFAWHQYRLQTEADWEYACCVRTTTVFHISPTVSSLSASAWSRANPKGRTHPVGQNCRTHRVCTTCTAMSGNGASITTVAVSRHLRVILSGQWYRDTGYSEEALGKHAERLVEFPFVENARRLTVLAESVSVSCAMQLRKVK